MKAIIAAVWRAIRVAVAGAAGYFLADLLKQPALIAVAPLLSAIFKYIRDAYPKLWWIPL